MSRLESGRITLEKTTLLIEDIVREAVVPVREIAEQKRLELRIDIPSGLVFEADAKAMHQILVNLLQNAVKFTPDSGCIAIRAKQINNAVNIYVEDNGIGIPKESLNKLARPFEQVEGELSKTYKGSGLGLAIARSLAELHHGSLRIRSHLGSGTMVMVHLPLGNPKLSS